MKKALLAISSVFLIAASAWIVYASPTIYANLTGAAEVGSAGDPDASGSATINVSAATDRLCYGVSVNDKITLPVTVYVLKGGPAENGSIVATLNAPTAPDAPATGCLDLDAALAKDMRQHPENYYVNVVNADYPDGAIRGQLAH